MRELKGNVPASARAEFDRGEAPAGTQLSRVRLVLSRTSEQQAALDKYDAELLDKSSPNYHKWLTPEQFGKLYGPADSDIAAIIAWLQSQGLQVDPVAPGRTSISFSGTVLQIEESFRTSIHSFDANGEQFLSNTVNPSIPAALAPVVSGIAHLDTVKPRPQYVRGRIGMVDPASGRMTAVPRSTSSGPRAELTGGSGTCPNAKNCDPYVLYMVPGDAATIYDTPNSKLNANFSGTSYTGKGVTIGLAGDATINAGTVAQYRNRFVGDTTQPTILYCGFQGSSTPVCSGSSAGLNIDNTDTDEAYLDTEVSGGLAPSATIYYYASPDLYGAIEAAINQNTVDIFSLSFGLCEQEMTTSFNAIMTGWWQQAASQGIAVTVSTGDSGSAGCDYQPANGLAANGLMVNGFASTPYNIAVGGTDFGGLVPSGNTYTAGTFLQYVGDANSGATTNLYRSALKYIPESTWNDSTWPNTSISADVPYTDSNGNTNIFGGGGGKSNCSASTTAGNCTSGYPKPSWQRGTGVPSDGVRDLPDVSFMSGAGGDYAAWLICDDETGPNSNNVTITANCTNQSDGFFYFSGIGGTSAAAPAFAGMLAMVQEKAGSRLGQAAKEIYDLYNSANAASIFHDITVGNISVPCSAGTPNCQKNTAGNYFLTGYDTGTGYDLATGIGSVDVANLVKYWSTGVVGTATAGVNISAPPTTISANATTVTVAVTGGSGTPTGTVTLSGGGYTSTAQTLDNTGRFVFTIPPYTLRTNDVVILRANYSGDQTYAANSGTGEITVNLSAFTLSAADVTVKAGTPGTSAITVTPANGYTGTVTLTAQVVSGPSGSVDAPTFTGSSVSITDSSPRQGTITVSTTVPAAVRAGGGTAWFRTAGGTVFAAFLLFFLPLGSRRGRRILCALLVIAAAAFTAIGCGGGSGGGGGGGGSQKTTPGVTVSTSKSAYSTAEAVPVSVSISGGTALATGSITVSGGSYNSGSQTMSNGGVSVTIPSNTLSAGSVTLTATYSGDSNFNSGSGAATLTISKPGTTAGTYTILVTGTGNDPGATAATTQFTLTVN